MAGPDHQQLLLCRVGPRLCALPLEQIGETMRPQPTEAVSGAPSYVRGLAIIRGVPIPVLDAARLLGAGDSPVARFITIGRAPRMVALAVAEVLGIRAIARDSFHELPSLLRDISGEAVSAIGALDTELLLLLRTGRLVPDDLWPALGAAAS